MLTIYTEALAKNACETYSDYEYIYIYTYREKQYYNIETALST